jgi:hypothetical protein
MVEKIVLELSDKDIVKNYFIPSQDKNTKKVEDLNLNSDLKKEIISTLTIM